MNPAISFLAGWYDEERDGSRPFRWMGRVARCRVASLPSDRAWLRLEASHASPGPSPALSVSIGGRPVGRQFVSADAAAYLFPVPEGMGGPLDVDFELDRTFTVPGDSRELGIAVRALDIVVPERIGVDGWYGWQDEEYFRFRWMGLEARLPEPAGTGRFVALPVCSLMEDGRQVLTVRAGEQPLAEIALFEGWHIYDLALPDAATSGGDWTLRVNTLAPTSVHPGDPREVAIKVGVPERHDDRRRHELARRFYAEATEREADAKGEGAERTAHADYRPDDPDGWYWWEYQDDVSFRWMQEEAAIRVPAHLRGDYRFCTVPVFSEFNDLSQRLAVRCAGQTLLDVPLTYCWSYCTFALPAPSGQDVLLRLSVNKLVPADRHPNDNRELGLRVGPLRFHDDQAKEATSRFVRENAALNLREMEAGATVLSSFPTNLGIDLYGKCNINPPCVYCLWDRMKEMEGSAVGTLVDEKTFEEYGPFFEGAQTLTNCSFGEPLLHPKLEAVLEFFERHDKLVQLATNGQAFTPGTVRAVAGKPLSLFISLDSASASTYARLRNDRWNDVVMGLTYLRDLRRSANRLPKVNMVFMPMRANLHDLEAYFKLCRMVAADSLVLRPLLRLEESHIVVDRGGYHYDYDAELLDRRELEQVFERVERWSRLYRVPVSNQFDFGK